MTISPLLNYGVEYKNYYETMIMRSNTKKIKDYYPAMSNHVRTPNHTKKANISFSSKNSRNNDEIIKLLNLSMKKNK